MCIICVHWGLACHQSDTIIDYSSLIRCQPLLALYNKNTLKRIAMPQQVNLLTIASVTWVATVFDYFISLQRLSFKNLNPFSSQQTPKCKFWLAFILIYQGIHCCTKVCNLQLQTVRVVTQRESSGWLSLYSEYCEVTSLFMSVDVKISKDHV